jgi:hypothetical protein
MKLKELTGQVFGKLKILKRAANKGKRRTAWFAKCECGNECIVAADDLKTGATQSCGCIRRNGIIEFNRRKRPKKEKELKKTKSYEEFFKEAVQRFQMNIEKTHSCWNWKGSQVRGYGVIFFKKNIKAHRFSYFLHKGKLNDRLLVCHTCDNSLCVNPEHLYQGTEKDNARDSVIRKRRRSCEKHHKSKLKEKDIKEILSSNETGRHLAKKFGVHSETIYRIRRGLSWKNASD